MRGCVHGEDLRNDRRAYTGSGIETIAHLRDNGRITLMFCAFQGPPKIVRCHGTGEAIMPTDPRFPELFRVFDGMAEHALQSTGLEFDKSRPVSIGTPG